MVKNNKLALDPYSNASATWMRQRTKQEQQVFANVLVNTQMGLSITRTERSHRAERVERLRALPEQCTYSAPLSPQRTQADGGKSGHRCQAHQRAVS